MRNENCARHTTQCQSQSAGVICSATHSVTMLPWLVVYFLILNVSYEKYIMKIGIDVFVFGVVEKQLDRMTVVLFAYTIAYDVQDHHFLLLLK